MAVQRDTKNKNYIKLKNFTFNRHHTHYLIRSTLGFPNPFPLVLASTNYSLVDLGLYIGPSISGINLGQKVGFLPKYRAKQKKSKWPYTRVLERANQHPLHFMPRSRHEPRPSWCTSCDVQGTLHAHQ